MRVGLEASLALLVLCVSFISLVTYTSFSRLVAVPDPLLESENATRFSEGKAWVFLEDLTSLGPRVVGTAVNEVWAPTIVLKQIFQGLHDLGWEISLSVPYEMPRLLTERHTPDKVDLSEDGRHSAEGGPTIEREHGSAHWDNIAAVDDEVKGGCVCPNEQEAKSGLSYSVPDIQQRLGFALYVCHATPEPSSGFVFPESYDQHQGGIERLRKFLKVEKSKGCTHAWQWVLADVLVRKVQLSFGVHLDPWPVISDNLSAGLLKHLKDVAITSVAYAPFVKKSLSSNICMTPGALARCHAHGKPKHVVSGERFFLQRSEDARELVALDLSWTHDASGHFVLHIPTGGSLVNAYQNLTNIALRVTPAHLLFLPVDTAENRNVEIFCASLFNRKVTLNHRLSEVRWGKEWAGAALSQSAKIDLKEEALPWYGDLAHPGVQLASHFDTVLGSPGAADAGAGVAVAIEVLRNLLAHWRVGSVLRRPCVIHLNGGEEHILAGAHGYAQSHPWAHSVSEFLNLEAAGNWGKAYLLRAFYYPPDSLLRVYERHVKNPHVIPGSGFAFEKGLIPGLTDFQIFRDYLLLEGIDFALGSGGYYYHTPLDSLGTLQPGSLQYYGNTVGAMARALLQRGLRPVENALHVASVEGILKKGSETVAPYITFRHLHAARKEKLKKGDRERQDVTIDVLGAFVIVVSLKMLTGHLVLGAVALLFVLEFGLGGALFWPLPGVSRQASNLQLNFAALKPEPLKGARPRNGQMVSTSGIVQSRGFYYASLCRRWFWLMWDRLCGILWLLGAEALGILMTGVFASVVVHQQGFGMRWFARPWLSILLYGPIAVLVVAEILHWRAKRLGCLFDPSRSAQRLEEGIYLGSICLYLILFCLGRLTGSSIVIYPLCLSIGAVGGRLIGRALICFKPRCFWYIGGSVVGNAIAFLILCPYHVALVDHLVPAFGRIVPPHPPDVIVAGLNVLFVYLYAPLLTLTPLVPLLVSGRGFRVFRFVAYGLVLPIILAYVSKQPIFTPKIPKRLDVVHFYSRQLVSELTSVNEMQPQMELERQELGISFQGMDSAEDAENLRYGGALKSVLASYVRKLPSEEKGVQIIPVTPETAFYWYPQGTAIRMFASPYLHIIPMNTAPPIFDASGDAVQRSTNAWLFDEEPFIKTKALAEVMPYSSRHPELQLRWDATVIDPEKNVWRLTVTIKGPSKMFIFIPAHETILKWSFSEVLLPPRPDCRCYAIIFAAGVASSPSLSFTVDVQAHQNMSETHLLNVVASATYADVLTVPLEEALKAEAELREQGSRYTSNGGEYVTTTVSVGELVNWRLKHISQ